jgi:hypothetical protein
MSILSQQNCHPTGVVKGICGPPKGMKMASVPQPLFMEASLSPDRSASGVDLQFNLSSLTGL